MEKLLKKLHKKLDKNLEKDKQLKDALQAMNALLKEEKIVCDEKDLLVFLKKEILCKGIENKRAIEKAYLEGYAKMHDYFDTLDYLEKQRLMNYEVDLVTKDLINFEYDGQKIFIPFFDVKLNAIYEKETVLFALKQYREIMFRYHEMMQEDLYGIEVYKSAFSSITYAYGYQDDYALYCQDMKRLFFIHQGNAVDFVTIENMDETLMVNVCESYFNREQERFVAVLESSNNIDEKLAKKLKKLI